MNEALYGLSETRSAALRRTLLQLRRPKLSDKPAAADLQALAAGPISEQVTGARVRPFDNEREAFGLKGSGQYAHGGLFQRSGSVVICCETSGGVLEFAVERPDVDLVLHFFNRLADQERRSASTEDT